MDDDSQTSPAPVSAKKSHLLRHILTGFFAIAPLYVTWWVFQFMFGLLANAGKPLVSAAASLIEPISTTASQWLLATEFQNLMAVLLTLLTLYIIGLLATQVIGRQLIKWMEDLMIKLPGVQIIYKATKRFIETLSNPSVKGQRVVLINFPSSEMKAVGLVTRVLIDTDTGKELAAVYVPTSPNPTSGYIEIVPMDDVVPTDWTFEEAMNFVMTGGANSPDTVKFRR